MPVPVPAGFTQDSALATFDRVPNNTLPSDVPTSPIGPPEDAQNEIYKARDQPMKSLTEKPITPNSLLATHCISV